MYSLGVIFYEMWMPAFDTGMERHTYLTTLRRTGEPPKHLNGTDDIPKQVHSIIRWLLNHNPRERPSASQLLESPHLPARTETEEQYFQEMLRIVARPQFTLFEKLIQSLFSQPTRDQIDFTFDTGLVTDNADRPAFDYQLHGATRYHLLEQTRHDASRVLERVFRIHGAERFHTGVVVPWPAEPSSVTTSALGRMRIMGLHMYESCLQALSKALRDVVLEVAEAAVASNAPVYLDSAGTRVCLPFDLCTPFARFVGRQRIQRLKRFAIDRVFRRSKDEMKPRELLEGSIDILCQPGDSMGGWQAEQQTLGPYVMSSARVLGELVAAPVQDKGGVSLSVEASQWLLTAGAAETEAFYIVRDSLEYLNELHRDRRPGRLGSPTIQPELSGQEHGALGAYYLRCGNARVLRGLRLLLQLSDAQEQVLSEVLSAASYTAWEHLCAGSYRHISHSTFGINTAIACV